MEAMSLLVVERGADWSHWAAATQLLGSASVVLVQQADESSAAFRARIAERVTRLTTRAIKGVVLLRARRRRRRRRGAGTGRFLRELLEGAKQGLQIFPAPVARPSHVRV